LLVGFGGKETETNTDHDGRARREGLEALKKRKNMLSQREIYVRFLSHSVPSLIALAERHSTTSKKPHLSKL
jgi:hypothetical protein